MWIVLGIKEPCLSWVAVAMTVCILPLALSDQMALECHEVDRHTLFFLKLNIFTFPVAVSYCFKCQLLLTEGPNLVECLALARLKSVIFPWIFLSPLPWPVGFLRLAHLCTESANALVIDSFYLGPRNPLRVGVLWCQGCWHSHSAFIAHGQMPCKIPFAFAALGLTNMEGGRGAANVTTPQQDVLRAKLETR